MPARLMLIHDDQGKNGTDQEQQHQPEAVRMRGQQRQTCRSQEKNTQNSHRGFEVAWHEQVLTRLV